MVWIIFLQIKLLNSALKRTVLMQSVCYVHTLIIIFCVRLISCWLCYNNAMGYYPVQGKCRHFNRIFSPYVNLVLIGQDCEDNKDEIPLSTHHPQIVKLILGRILTSKTEMVIIFNYTTLYHSSSIIDWHFILG